MRAYFLNNMYLSSIQNGIQAAHAIHTMMVKYDRAASPQLWDWAENHQTMIVLSGGMTEHLETALPYVEASGLPWATFYEPGIGNALTSIGVIVPEKLYANKVADVIAAILTGTAEETYSEAELDFMAVLEGLPLAR